MRVWSKEILFLQERIAKVVAFILSLQSDFHRPFLIISTPPTLCCWDNEFFHLAPSIDVVVYSGNKDLRRSIRTIEFDGVGGYMMFQVLVTSPEAIIEVSLSLLVGFVSIRNFLVDCKSA